VLPTSTAFFSPYQYYTRRPVSQVLIYACLLSGSLAYITARVLTGLSSTKQPASRQAPRWRLPIHLRQIPFLPKRHNHQRHSPELLAPPISTDMARDEKLPLPTPAPARSANALSSRSLSCVSFFVSFLALVFLSCSSGIFSGRPVEPPGKNTYIYFPKQKPTEAGLEGYESLVSLEAHIMSKCPDAKVRFVWQSTWSPACPSPCRSRASSPGNGGIANRLQDCLHDMVLPVMQRVHDKVNFTLSFIGTPTDNDGVACKHGPEECQSSGPTNPR